MSTSWKFGKRYDPLDEYSDCGFLMKWGWFYAISVAATFSFFFSGVPGKLFRRVGGGRMSAGKMSKLGMRQVRTITMLSTFFTLVITVFGTAQCLQTGNGIGTRTNIAEPYSGRWTKNR